MLGYPFLSTAKEWHKKETYYVWYFLRMPFFAMERVANEWRHWAGLRLILSLRFDITPPSKEHEENLKIILIFHL